MKWQEGLKKFKFSKATHFKDNFNIVISISSIEFPLLMLQLCLILFGTINCRMKTFSYISYFKT